MRTEQDNNIALYTAAELDVMVIRWHNKQDIPFTINEVNAERKRRGLPNLW